MLVARRVISVFSLSIMVVGPCTAVAQNYPVKPIRIVTSSAGSSTDTVSRLIARGLAANLGQPVVIDNRGGGFIQGEIVAKAPPDGYTMVVAAGGLWISPLLQPSPYDPVKDFSPVSLVTTTPNVLFVHPSVAASSVKDLVALAKAKPGVLNYASGATGGTSHLAGELFNSLAAVKIIRIPYKSAAQQLTDLLSGQVQLQFNSLDGMQDYLKSGRVKALAVGSVKPSTLLPGIPTVAATLPGFESVVSLGMFAPPNTPKAIINRVNQEVARILRAEESRTQLLGIAVEAAGTSPEALASTVIAEMTRFGKLIKDAGITVQ